MAASSMNCWRPSCQLVLLLEIRQRGAQHDLDSDGQAIFIDLEAWAVVRRVVAFGRISRADAEVAAGNRIEEEGHVVAGRNFMRRDDVLRAHCPGGGMANQRCHTFIADAGRATIKQLKCCGCAQASRDLLRDFVDARRQMLAILFRKGTECALKGHFVRNDIGGCATVKAANGDNRRIERRDFAADKRLQGHNDLRGGQNRVGAEVRHGAVSTAPTYSNGELIGTGGQRSRADGHLADGPPAPKMQPNHRVPVGVFKGAISDHAFGASLALFGGLKEECDVAMQFITMSRQDVGNGEGNGSVAVVAAGVHLARNLRLEGEIVLFLKGQGVNVGTNGERLAWRAAMQHAHDAGLPYVGADFQAAGAQALSNNTSGAYFFQCQFGMLMKVAAQGYQGITMLGNLLFDVHKR